MKEYENNSLNSLLPRSFYWVPLFVTSVTHPSSFTYTKKIYNQVDIVTVTCPRSLKVSVYVKIYSRHIIFHIRQFFWLVLNWAARAHCSLVSRVSSMTLTGPLKRQWFYWFVVMWGLRRGMFRGLWGSTSSGSTYVMSNCSSWCDIRDSQNSSSLMMRSTIHMHPRGTPYDEVAVLFFGHVKLTLHLVVEFVGFPEL